MTLHPDSFKEALKLWASGVTVVTVAHNGQRYAVTASSFSSVSVTPPLILVCLHQEVTALPIILEKQTFAVSILSENQTHLSAQMAGMTPLPEGEDRFYKVTTETTPNGDPVPFGGLAWLDCKLYAAHDAGTHKILIGEVQALTLGQSNLMPLIYYNRAYRYLPKRETLLR
ncbi:MAG: flavin reductase family protein [Phototrophicaceae bacterium]